MLFRSRDVVCVETDRQLRQRWAGREQLIQQSIDHTGRVKRFEIVIVLVAWPKIAKPGANDQVQMSQPSEWRDRVGDWNRRLVPCDLHVQFQTGKLGQRRKHTPVKALAWAEVGQQREL